MKTSEPPGGMPNAEKDAHAGCHEAWEQQKRRAKFAEARLDALVVELRRLAHAMDGIQGHATHSQLGGKTLGGAVRNVADGEHAPRVTPPPTTTRSTCDE